MGMLDWLIGVGVEYSDGGAPEKVKSLAASARDANKAFLDLCASADKISASLGKVTAAAETADTAIFGLATSFGTAASAANAASTASGVAASGFRAAAGAAAASERATRSAARGMKEYADAWRATAMVISTSGPFASSQAALPAAASRAALPWTPQLALAGGYGMGVMVNDRLPGPSIPMLGGGGTPSFPITPYSFNAPSMGAGGAGIGGGGGPLMLTGGTSGAITPYGQVLRARRMPWKPNPFSDYINMVSTGAGIGVTNALDFTEGALGYLAPKAWEYGKKAAKYGAIGALGFGIDAAHEAGELQQILTSIQNVTGADAATMARIRQAAYNTGNMSGTSVSESASMFREIARNSVGSMSTEAMLGLLPQIAKMQVVLGATRGFTPEQTVDNTMAIVHLLRKYDPKFQPKAMDTTLRMAELMPSNLSQAVTQLTYMLPTLKNLKVSDEDAMSLMVALSRFGMGRNKGGASIQNLMAEAIGPLQMTQHMQKGKALLLGPKGLNVIDEHGNSRFFNDKGQGNVMGFLDALANYEKIHGSIQTQKVLKGAFGTVGSRAGDLLADPVIIDQLHKIHDAIKEQTSLGLNAQAKSIFDTQNFQAHRAWSNFQSLATEIGTYAIPGLTKGLQDLGDAFHEAQIWLHHHGDVEKKIQKEIYDDVVGTEKFIVSHKETWKELGHYMGDAAKDAKDLTTSISGLVDPMMRIIGYAKANIKFMGGGGLNPNDALTPDEVEHNRLVKEHAERNARLRGATIPGPTQPGPTRAALAARNAAQNAQIGPPILNILPGGVHVDARGMTPEQASKAVSDGIQKAFQGVGDQRSRTGNTGTIHTSPYQPSALSTPPPNR